jgi:uncharacterized protein involved in response to NO
VTTPRRAQRSRPPFANAFFFPAAALYGMLALPWSVLGFAGYVPVLPGLATPVGHGHEMLFGYAFAVVAGYLLGPQPLRITLPLLGLWLLARLGFLVWPGSWLAIGSVGLFAVGVAAKVVPRFGQAKKWRNRTVAPVVAGFALLATIGSVSFGAGAARDVLLVSLVALSVLLFFMGGRILAPAIAGHLNRQGRPLTARVQPRLEAGGLVGLFGALALLLTPIGGTDRVAGAVLMGVGVLAAVRLARWRLVHCRGRYDLLMLALGYGWLAAGLLMLGAALLLGFSVLAALHALTVGAIGSLTVAVMGRTRLLYRFRDANVMPSIHVAVLLMSVAALARLAYALPLRIGDAVAVLIFSAVCWSASLGILLVVLVRTLPGRNPRSRSEHDGTPGRL